MTSTLELVRPETALDTPTAPPVTFSVGAALSGGAGLGRGTFVGPAELTLDAGRITLVGSYIERRRGMRGALEWFVSLGVLVVSTLALWLVTPLPEALAVGILAFGMVTWLLVWTRRRPRTGELNASDVTVKRIRGRRVWMRGPFELERPEARPTLVVAARNKADAAALAQLLS